MRHRRTIAELLTMTALCGVAACSSNGGSIDTIAPTSRPPATLPPPTSATTSTATSGSDPTTTPPTEASATTLVPDGVARLSDDGPWRLVDSAPGVTTPGLVYELMPKLWAFLPTEESDNDGNLFVPSPADIPIIEAYLQATLTYFRSADQTPIDFADPGWTAFYTDGGASYFDVLRARDAQRQHIDLDAGVVVVPRVLGEARTDSYAIVFDCTFDGSVWRMPDGELASGSTPGVVRTGFSAVAHLTSVGWQVDGIADQAEACS